MNFVVSFGRESYIANVSELERVNLSNEMLPNYFETKYKIDLFEDNNYMLTAYFQKPYNEEPDILDVTNAISAKFNRFVIYFSKYGKVQ